MTPASPRGGLAGSIAYVLVIIIWGASFFFTKPLDGVLTPMQVSFVRLASGLLPVLVFALVTRSLRLQHLRYLHHFFVMSVLSNSLYFWAIAVGTYRLDTSVAGILPGMIPVFTFLVAVFVLRSESITLAKTIGVAAGIVGVLLLAQPWNAGEIDPSGVGIMLFSAFIYGVSFAYAKRFITPLGIPAAAGATYQMGLATLTLLIVTPLDGLERLASDPQALWFAVVGLGMVGTGVATVLYYVIVRSFGAVTASTTTYFPPIVAVSLGLFVLHEPFRPLVPVALALLLAAAFLTGVTHKKPNAPPPATI